MKKLASVRGQTKMPLEDWRHTMKGTFILAVPLLFPSVFLFRVDSVFWILILGGSIGGVGLGYWLGRSSVSSGILGSILAGAVLGSMVAFTIVVTYAITNGGFRFDEIVKAIFGVTAAGALLCAIGGWIGNTTLDEQAKKTRIDQKARTERQAKASRVTGAPAGLWQRVVMGLAGFMLLIEAVLPAIWMTAMVSGGFYPDIALLWTVLAAILILGGSGFVFAAARPPYGVLRRIIVGAAILVPFLGMAAVPALFWFSITTAD